MNLIKTSILFVSSLILAANSHAQDIGISFIEIAEKSVPQKSVRSQVISSSKAYKKIFGHAVPTDINWKSQVVLLLNLGDRPSSGYKSTLRTLKVAGGTAVAGVTIEAPGSDCAVASVITPLYSVVKVSRDEKDYLAKAKLTTWEAVKNYSCSK